MREIDGWYISTLDQDVWNHVGTGANGDWADEEIDRKKFALTVQKGVDGVVMPDEYKSFMFSLLDGRDIQERVWEMVEPRGGDK